MFDNQVNDVPFEEQQAQAEGQNVETTMTEESNPVSEVEPSPAEGQGGEIVQGGEAEATPEWQKEFASPEDLYTAYANTKKSYDHIRPKLTQTTQQLSELKKKANAPQVQSETIPQSLQPVQQVAQPQQSAEEIVKNFIAESNRPVVEQVEQIMLNQEISNVASKYKDFDQYGEKITEIMQSNPAMWNVPNAIENAYKLAKFDSIGTNIDNAIQDATKEAYANKQIKVLGTGNKSQPSTQELQPKQVSAEDQAANDIVASVARKKSIFF